MKKQFKPQYKENLFQFLTWRIHIELFPSTQKWRVSRPLLQKFTQQQTTCHAVTDDDFISFDWRVPYTKATTKWNRQSCIIMPSSMLQSNLCTLKTLFKSLGRKQYPWEKEIWKYHNRDAGRVLTLRSPELPTCNTWKERSGFFFYSHCFQWVPVKQVLSFPKKHALLSSRQAYCSLYSTIFNMKTKLNLTPCLGCKPSLTLQNYTQLYKETRYVSQPNCALESGLTEFLIDF